MMIRPALIASLVLLPVAWGSALVAHGARAQGGAAPKTAAKRVQSRVQTERNGDVFLIQEMSIRASVAKVWDAYTSSKGWTSWVAPVAHVDLRIGGRIVSNYREDGKLTDEDAVVLHVINYVPQRALTLQAELAPHFPKILKDREKQMYNLITFEPLGEDKTKLVAYGIGYRDSPELRKMLDFFVKGNEVSFLKLIDYVENGKVAPYVKKVK